jgi:hypothetical protein
MSLAATSIQSDVRNQFRSRASAVSEPDFLMPGYEYENILHWASPAPVGSALLGICPDGFPLLLKLCEPGTSGMLIQSRVPGPGRTLFSLILSSALYLNQSGTIQASLISPHLDEFSCPPNGAYEFSWAEAGEDKALALLFAFVAAVEDHWNGHPDGILRLLLLDEVDQIFPSLDPFSQEVLIWAASEGPGASCQVIASLTHGGENVLPRTFLDAFGLRIDDRIPVGGLPGQRTPGPNSSQDYFTSDRSGNAIQFRLPQ